jgi:hypothetical protein
MEREMARFTFRMPEQWLRRCARGDVSERPFRTMHLSLDPDMPCGPGWFESSWDLEQGLLVHEGPPGDAKLLEWLDDCVARCAVADDAEVPTLSQALASITMHDAFEFDTGGLELAG